MNYIKFTSVKLIVYTFCLVCLVSLLFPVSSLGIPKFVVQIGASKTPVNIHDFAKQYNVTDSITEIRSGDWYRYVIGNFQNYDSALNYSKEIVGRTRLPQAFPRSLKDDSGTIRQVQKPDSSRQLQEPPKIIPADSVQPMPEKIQANPDKNLNPQSEVRKIQNRENSIFLWLIGDKNIFELKHNLVDYGNKHFSGYLLGLYIRVVEDIYSYPIILLFLFLILFFIVNFFFVLQVLYFTNRKKNHKERYINIYRNLYEQALLSYLFGESDWEKTAVKLKNIKKPLNRKIFTSILFNFQENLRGEMDKRIPEIFEKLGLNRDALESAKSSFYYRKVQGIRELTYFYSEGALKIIPDYLNDSNDLVRAEAQTSYIRLHEDKPFEFFRTLTTPFTRWTQLIAFYLFRLHQLPVMPFVDFLDSEHPNVRNFSLQMIIFFQQLENTSEILKLLNSQNELTRFLSIRAINDLRLYDGKELIKKKYPVETEKNKLEIIKALCNIGSGEDFDFLESILKSGSVSAKTEACRSMYFMNNAGMERILQLNQESDLIFEPYIAHVTDPRN